MKAVKKECIKISHQMIIIASSDCENKFIFGSRRHVDKRNGDINKYILALGIVDSIAQCVHKPCYQKLVTHG